MKEDKFQEVYFDHAATTKAFPVVQHATVPVRCQAMF